MELRLRILRDAYLAYGGLVCNLGLYVVALVYLIIKDEKKRNFVLYQVFGVLLLATPFIANKVMTYHTEYGNHWYVYGILSVAVVVAYAGTTYVTSLPKQVLRLGAVAFFVILLQFGNGFAYTSDALLFSVNAGKVSAEAMELAQRVMEVEEPVVLATDSVATELKKCNKEIKIIYDDAIAIDWENVEQLCMAADEYSCNCLILETVEEEENDILLEYGFLLREETAGYVLYTR